MNERISHIAAQAFRGIREEFSIDLEGGRSCVVLGENGTGKSSLADALEWYFTGQLELLTKEGRGDAIRHTGARPPVETKVSIDTNGHLGGQKTETSAAPDVARQIGRDELFLLRGRTLAKFVDQTKGDKWKELSTLLGLESIDRFRLDLQRARNFLESKASDSASDFTNHKNALANLIPQVSEEGIYEGLKFLCNEVGVTPPDSLDQALAASWIKTIEAGETTDPIRSGLTAANIDLSAVSQQSVSATPISEWNLFVQEANRDLLTFQVFRAAKRLLDSADSEFDKCMLCGQDVQHSTLAETIVETLGELESVEASINLARQSVRLAIRQIRQGYNKRKQVQQRVIQFGHELADLPAWPSLNVDSCLESVSELNLEQIEQLLEALESWDADSLDAIEEAMPSPATEREQTLVNIGVLHTHAQKYRAALSKKDLDTAAFQTAHRMFSRYQQRQREYVNDTLNQISSRVAELYSFLHPESGMGAVAIETVGDKGVELSVEFFGKKERPPHRVLSESHLNSLGLALFLAMAETFNERIGFLMLDDVITSLDREHRGRLAKLLADKSEGTQFIVLTHDEHFFNQISVRAPNWIKTEFTSWSYDDGPRLALRSGDRLLDQAKVALVEGDRIGAAQKGRRVLEEILQEACEALEALLPFRRGVKNHQREAQEVMNGLRRALRSRARLMYQELKPLMKSLETDLQALLNVESHANQDATSNQEIHDALSDISELRDRFTCCHCKTRIWHIGSPDSSRCRCGLSRFPPSQSGD